MDRWQLTDFENPDNKFRVVRNLCNVVSRLPYSTIFTKIVASVWSRPPIFTTVVFCGYYIIHLLLHLHLVVTRTLVTIHFRVAFVRIAMIGVIVSSHVVSFTIFCFCGYVYVACSMPRWVFP